MDHVVSTGCCTTDVWTGRVADPVTISSLWTACASTPNALPNPPAVAARAMSEPDGACYPRRTLGCDDLEEPHHRGCAHALDCVHYAVQRVEDVLAHGDVGAARDPAGVVVRLEVAVEHGEHGGFDVGLERLELLLLVDELPSLLQLQRHLQLAQIVQDPAHHTLLALLCASAFRRGVPDPAQRVRELGSVTCAWTLCQCRASHIRVESDASLYLGAGSFEWM
eukprot:2647489-Rhodomonas_salina.2